MNLENNKNKTTPLVLVILLVLFAFIFGGGSRGNYIGTGSYRQQHICNVQKRG